MKRIIVRMGRTINTGDFENKKIELGIEKDIPDDADEQGEMDDIMNTLEDMLDDEESAILEEALDRKKSE